MLSNATFLNIIYQSIEDGVLVINQFGKILWVNRTLEKMFGYSEGELLNEQLDILVHAEAKEKHVEQRLHYAQNPYTRSSDSRIEFRGLTKGGKPLWLRIGLSSYTENGEVYSIASVCDVTQQKVAEIGMRKQTDRANMFLNLSKTIFIELNKQGVIQLINNEGCALLESSQEAIIGKNWFKTFIDKKDQARVRKLFKAFMNGENTGPTLVNSPVLTKSGCTKLIQWHNTVLKDDSGNKIGTLSSGIDITEQEALKKQQTDTIIIATERERKRVAMELHDSIVQAVSAVSMNLKSLEDYVEILPTNGQKAYHDAIKLVGEIIDDTRAISHDLMPHNMLQGGLERVLENLVERTNQMYQIKVSIDTDFRSESLNQMQEMNIYRIIQEFFQNSIKHANASQIKLKMHQSANKLQIKLQDDGQGFDLRNEGIQPSGIGLKNIKARVESMDGELHFISSSGNGTELKLTIYVTY